MRHAKCQASESANDKTECPASRSGRRTVYRWSVAGTNSADGCDQSSKRSWRIALGADEHHGKQRSTPRQPPQTLVVTPVSLQQSSLLLCHIHPARKDRQQHHGPVTGVHKRASEQCLTSPPTQYRLSGRQFYRSEYTTNSVKILKEKMLQK